MQKQSPTPFRLVVIAVFALSCFGLLLFLWLSFGGAIPLKAKGYRFQVAFPQAVQLAEQSDVRTAGISVGKVISKQLDPAGNRTLATIQLDPRFAPLHCDARAILRQKTLLGETFVELTPGTAGSRCLIKENGRLSNAQVTSNVYLDQVLQAFDPVTRQAFRNWQQDLAAASYGNGQKLNDAFGELPQFVADAGDVLNVLNSQSGAVSRLIRNTGTVFGALNRDTTALHNAVVNSGKVFQTTSDEQNNLAETFKIFPTFLNESRATFTSLQGFSTNTDPLVRNLRPVARDLVPTLADLKAFAPDLRSTFQHLDPLITSSKTALPALRDILQGAGPLLGSLDPFLEQLNPILQFLELYQHQTADFISNGAAGLAAVAPTGDPGQVGHYLRQFSPVGLESLAIFKQRPASNRGNTYLGPVALQGPEATKNLIFPETDCNNAGGDQPPVDVPILGHPGCTTQAPIQFQGQAQKHVHVQPDNYNP